MPTTLSSILASLAYTLTVERNSPVEGSGGGQEVDYSVGNRGSLPTSVEAVPTIPQSVPRSYLQETLAFGVRGSTATWLMVCFTNPEVTTADRVLWTDDGGTDNTAKCVTKSVKPQRGVDLWYFYAEDDSTVT